MNEQFSEILWSTFEREHPKISLILNCYHFFEDGISFNSLFRFWKLISSRTKQLMPISNFFSTKTSRECSNYKNRYPFSLPYLCSLMNCLENLSIFDDFFKAV